jgi:hypothetical protein
VQSALGLMCFLLGGEPRVESGGFDLHGTPALPGAHTDDLLPGCWQGARRVPARDRPDPLYPLRAPDMHRDRGIGRCMANGQQRVNELLATEEAMACDGSREHEPPGCGTMGLPTFHKSLHLQVSLPLLPPPRRVVVESPTDGFLGVRTAWRSAARKPP